MIKHAGKRGLPAATLARWRSLGCGKCAPPDASGDVRCTLSDGYRQSAAEAAEASDLTVHVARKTAGGPRVATCVVGAMRTFTDPVVCAAPARTRA